LPNDEKTKTEKVSDLPANRFCQNPQSNPVSKDQKKYTRGLDQRDARRTMSRITSGNNLGSNFNGPCRSGGPILEDNRLWCRFTGKKEVKTPWGYLGKGAKKPVNTLRGGVWGENHEYGSPMGGPKVGCSYPCGHLFGRIPQRKEKKKLGGKTVQGSRSPAPETLAVTRENDPQTRQNNCTLPGPLDMGTPLVKESNKHRLAKPSKTTKAWSQSTAPSGIADFSKRVDPKRAGGTKPSPKTFWPGTEENRLQAKSWKPKKKKNEDQNQRSWVKVKRAHNPMPNRNKVPSAGFPPPPKKKGARSHPAPQNTFAISLWGSQPDYDPIEKRRGVCGVTSRNRRNVKKSCSQENRKLGKSFCPEVKTRQGPPVQIKDNWGQSGPWEGFLNG